MTTQDQMDALCSAPKRCEECNGFLGTFPILVLNRGLCKYCAQKTLQPIHDAAAVLHKTPGCVIDEINTWYASENDGHQITGVEIRLRTADDRGIAIISLHTDGTWAVQGDPTPRKHPIANLDGPKF